ncbi:hypothetical protein GGR22_001528 [Flavobacterium gossypii]|uniref:DUF4292 domain-containing protein n=1 Tax=Flavobacterium gossypii TaxID=1646119 RepID=A0ABR6DNY3_9FLAO|nr:DUF4292 domain-containing protein [Flavobacterium gossypii]MBA9073402.1 hypothetical protein [Flavobacterium gossypii]
MKKYIIIALGIFFFSCNSKKAVIAEGNASEVVASAKVIENHYKLKRNFSTVYIKSSAKYKDDKMSQSVSAEIRIKKDEQILVSIRFLGITMAKALITPKEVKYYEKIGNKFFEGDYSTLSKWLGTELDFQKVQNMLIGEAMDDLTKGKYTTTIDENLYKLEDNSNKNTAKSFYFEAANYLIKKQEVVQSKEDRRLQISYPSHKEYPETVLPAQLIIDAMQGGKKTNINIDYNSVSFNENLTFPYSVPDGYERIYID